MTPDYPTLDYPAALAAALCARCLAPGHKDQPGDLSRQLDELRRRWPRMSDEHVTEGVALFSRLLLAQQLDVLTQVERGAGAGAGH